MAYSFSFYSRKTRSSLIGLGRVLKARADEETALLDIKGASVQEAYSPHSGGFYYAMTLEQIGKELGITREAVRLIEKRALEKLRIRLNDVNFERAISIGRDSDNYSGKGFYRFVSEKDAEEHNKKVRERRRRRKEREKELEKKAVLRCKKTNKKNFGTKKSSSINLKHWKVLELIAEKCAFKSNKTIIYKNLVCLDILRVHKYIKPISSKKCVGKNFVRIRITDKGLKALADRER